MTLKEITQSFYFCFTYILWSNRNVNRHLKARRKSYAVQHFQFLTNRKPISNIYSMRSSTIYVGISIVIKSTRDFLILIADFVNCAIRCTYYSKSKRRIMIGKNQTTDNSFEITNTRYIQCKSTVQTSGITVCKDKTATYSFVTSTSTFFTAFVQFDYQPIRN